MSNKSKEPPKGLLSFVYHAMHDPVMSENVLVNGNEEMSKFELSDEAKAAILAAQTVEASDEEYKERLIELMSQELAAKFKDLW
jgi:hypothetical protein